MTRSFCQMKVTSWVVMVAGLATTACQNGVGSSAIEQAPAARSEYVEEFNRIDTGRKGRITLDQATTYYNARFGELDKNRDGFLDAAELESMVPAMGARSGKELLSKLDRNADNKVTRSEFLVITNWLFEVASSSNELALGDVERGRRAVAAGGKRYDPEAIPPGMPGKGGPFETTR
jgi:hypothetical protein